MRAITFAVLAAAAVAGAARAENVHPHKPAPPSSFAPKAHSGRHVYGAPIQPPIMRHVKKKPRHAADVQKASASRKSAATHTARAPQKKPVTAVKSKGRPASRCPETAAETGCVIESPAKALPTPAKP